jgi:hypothetical protein
LRRFAGVACSRNPEREARRISCSTKSEGPQILSKSEGHVRIWTYKPNSVRRCRRDGHSSRPAIAGQLKRPTRKFGAPSRHALRILLSGIPSLFGLAPCGVCPAPRITARAVRSYRTFSPLPRPKPGRYVFCGTFRRVALKPPSRTLSGTLLYGVRTFLSPGGAARGNPASTIRTATIRSKIS